MEEEYVRDEEAVEVEYAHSDGERDDGASDPESVLQEAAAELPLPPPPTLPPPLWDLRLRASTRFGRGARA